MDIGAAIADMWHTVIVFIPKAIAFVAILVIGWFIAGFLRKWVDKLLERVGFDRAVQRGGIGRWLAQGRYDASSIVAALVYYAALLFTLQLAFGLWGPNPVSELIEGVVAWLPRAAVAIVIVVVAAALASAVKDIVSNALAGLSYGRLLASLASVFIIGLGIIAALGQVGIATTVTMPVLIAVLATVAGILIVGVGGGMIRPMQQRWERWLSRAEQESETLKEHLLAHAAQRRDARAAAAEVQRQSVQSAEDTQVIPVPPVTATARPANSSMRTQLLPKVPAQSAYPSSTPPAPDTYPAQAAYAASTPAQNSNPDSPTSTPAQNSNPDSTPDAYPTSTPAQNSYPDSAPDTYAASTPAQNLYQDPASGAFPASTPGQSSYPDSAPDTYTASTPAQNSYPDSASDAYPASTPGQSSYPDSAPQPYAASAPQVAGDFPASLAPDTNSRDAEANVPAGRADAPVAKANAPEVRADSRATEANVPAGRADAPVAEANAPEVRADSRATEANAPEVRADSRGAEANMPAAKANPRTAKTDSPAGKANAPAGKASAVAGKASAPAAGKVRPGVPESSSEEAASGAAVRKTPTATGSAPVPPPADEHPTERTRAAADKK